MQGDAVRVDPDRAKLLATRAELRSAWRKVSDALRRIGKVELSSDINNFVAQMQPPMTDREWVAEKLLGPRSPHREHRKETTR
jgi:hypothetical protein